MKKYKKIFALLVAAITASSILLPVNAIELAPQATPDENAVEDPYEGEVIINDTGSEDSLPDLPTTDYSVEEIPVKKEPVMISELYKNEFTMLKELGIISEDVEAKTNVTRGEFSKIITLITGLPKGGNAEFSDITSETANVEYIKAAAQSELLLGFNDGTFRPDEPVTYAQTVTAILRMAGYDKLAEAKGGYPQGYFAVASENGLTGGYGADMPMSYANMMSLLYKAMTLEVIAMEGNSLGGISLVQSDMTVIEKFFGLVKGKGLVSAGEYVALKGRENTAKGSVVISSTDGEWLFDAGTSGIDNYVGYNTIYYYNEDDEIVIFEPDEKKMEAIEFTEEDFVSADNGLTTIEYTIQGSEKTKKLKLDSKADFVYNGVSCYEVTADDLNNADYLRLVDNNADGKFDIVYLTVYDIYMVDNVSYKNKIVQDKRNGIYLEIDEVDCEVKYIKSGYETDITSIVEWDILNVTVSRNTEKPLVIVEIVPDIIVGEVEGKDNSDREVKVGGEVFYVSKKVDMTSFNFGDNMVFGLNKYGAVVCSFNADSVQKKYAYLLKAYSAEGKEQESIVLRVIDNVGNIVRLPVSENFYINDNKGSWNALGAIAGKDFITDSGMDSFTAVHQLISYTTDKEGNVKRIYFAGDAKGAVNPTNQNSLILNKQFNGLRIRKNGNTINGEYVFNNDTPIFLIITDANGVIDEKQCGVYYRSGLNKLVEGVRPLLSVYDSGEDRIAKVLVITTQLGALTSYFDVMGRQGILVSNVTEACVDDEIVTMVEGYQNGGKVVLYESDYYDYSGWKRGDMWLTTNDLAYRVIGATKLFELFPEEGSKIMNPKMNFTPTFKAVRNLLAIDSEIADFTEAYTGVYGTLKEVIRDNNRSAVRVQVEGSDLELVYGISGTGITVYHTKTDKFEAISFDNVSVGLGSGKVFLYTRYGLCRDIVIID